jgi:hypothetical protein
MNAFTAAGASLVLVLLGGCGWSVGASNVEQVQKPTLGQQLLDLQRARDLGALDETEYSKKRQELIDAALASP